MISGIRDVLRQSIELNNSIILPVDAHHKQKQYDYESDSRQRNDDSERNC